MYKLFLCLRFLRSRVLAYFAMAGVALCVAMLVIVISVMSGFDHDLRSKILGFNAHLKIFALDNSGRTEPMENYENVMRLVSSNKNVLGVAPFVLGQVLVGTEPANTNVSPSLVGAPWLRAEAFCESMSHQRLAGVTFHPCEDGSIIDLPRSSGSPGCRNRPRVCDWKA